MSKRWGIIIMSSTLALASGSSIENGAGTLRRGVSTPGIELRVHDGAGTLRSGSNTDVSRHGAGVLPSGTGTLRC